MAHPGAEWEPSHGTHAIDIAAVVVVFAEPLPERIFTKILRTAEDRAFEAGLKSRHTTKGVQFQFAVGPQGVQPAAPIGMGGRIFNSVAETPEGGPIPHRIEEQLQIEQNSLVYRTWRYRPWAEQLERLKFVMSPGLAGALEFVGIASLRLEYLDKFVFHGHVEEARPALLFNENSGLIAHQVFAAGDLWHSHTGKFVEITPQYKHLQQIHIDALDEGDDHLKSRIVNVVIAREQRFNTGANEQAPLTEEAIFHQLDLMHGAIKADLSDLLREEIVRKIHLWDAQL